MGLHLAPKEQTHDTRKKKSRSPEFFHQARARYLVVAEPGVDGRPVSAAAQGVASNHSLPPKAHGAIRMEGQENSFSIFASLPSEI